MNLPSHIENKALFVVIDQTSKDQKEPFKRTIVPVNILAHPLGIQVLSDYQQTNAVIVRLTNNASIPIKKGTLTVVKADGSWDVMKTVVLSGINPGEMMEFALTTDGIEEALFKIKLESGFEDDMLKSIKPHIIPAVKKAIKIDGRPGEYTGLPLFSVNKAGQVRQMVNWGGPDDLSALGYMKWDAENLYLFVDSTDNVFCQPNFGWNIWNGDSIQFSVDTRKNTEVTGNGFADLGFAYSKTNKGTEKWRWIAPEGQMVEHIPEIKAVVVRKGSHTYYEAMIPWKYLGSADFKAEPGARLKFSFLVNDDDGSGRRGWLEYGAGIGYSKDSSLFIEAQLGD